MSKSAKKRLIASSASSVTAAKPSRQNASDPKAKKSDPASKQSRVIAMLQSQTGNHDCRDDEYHGLAATLGARLPCRRSAQATEAEAQLEEGRRQSCLPNDKRRQR